MTIYQVMDIVVKDIKPKVFRNLKLKHFDELIVFNERETLLWGIL